MADVKGMYRRVDDWVLGLSRGTYAVLIGFLSAIGALAVGLVFENPDYYFAFGIGLTLTVLYYLSDPNRREG